MSERDFKRSMNPQAEIRLSKVKKAFFDYAGFVEEALRQCREGLRSRSRDLLEEIREVHFPRSVLLKADMDEVSLPDFSEEHWEKNDLTYLLCLITSGKTIEKIFEHCLKMAEAGLDLLEFPPVRFSLDIDDLSDIVQLNLARILNGLTSEEGQDSWGLERAKEKTSAFDRIFFTYLLDVLREDALKGHLLVIEKIGIRLWHIHSCVADIGRSLEKLLICRNKLFRARPLIYDREPSHHA